MLLIKNIMYVLFIAIGFGCMLSFSTKTVNSVSMKYVNYYGNSEYLF